MAYSYGVTEGEVALRAVARIPATGTVAQLQAMTVEAQQTSNGPRAAAEFLYNIVRETTSVAVASYQFFTGSTPSSAGLDYLVSSDANASDLNDGYYAAFSLENRYINFAVNLGLLGEGAVGFSAIYGGMTFAQAVDSIYDTVIGKSVAAAAGYDVAAAIADIASRQSYFEAVARERAPNLDLSLATKAGLVGYVIAEAVKAEVGVYARAMENFYLDLTDGSGEYRVNLVGTYGPGTALDGVAAPEASEGLV